MTNNIVKAIKNIDFDSVVKSFTEVKRGKARSNNTFRNRVENSISEIEMTYEMALNKELYVDAIIKNMV